MGIITWMFLGLAAGALAKFIPPGKNPGGGFVTILMGIVGAVPERDPGCTPPPSTVPAPQRSQGRIASAPPKQ